MNSYSLHVNHYKLFLKVQFEMADNPDKISVQDIINSHPDIAKLTKKNGQGYLLVSQHNIQSKVLNAQKFGSPAGRTRAKNAFEKGYEPSRPGNRQKMNDADESMLECWALHLLEEGYTLYTSTLRRMVFFFFLLIFTHNLQTDIILSQYESRTVDEKSVSRGWVSHFLERHPSLQRKSTIIVDAARAAACTQLNLSPFYDQYYQFITDHKIKPELTFNLDETSINFSQRFKGKVITKENMPDPIVVQADRVLSCTLVLCIPARGKALDAQLLWPQQKIPAEFAGFPACGIRIQTGQSYQTRLSYERMMLDYFIPAMIERRLVLNAPSESVLLLVDGHNSRFSLEVIETCIASNIHIMVLPAHSSSITQPLDAKTNGVLKNVFAKEAAQLVNQLQNHSPIREDAQRHPAAEEKENPSEQIMKEPDQVDDDEKTEPIEKAVGDELDDEYSNLPSMEMQQKLFPERGPFTGSAAAHRELLAKVLPVALETALHSKVTAASWEAAGLFPFNKEAIMKQLPLGSSIIQPATKRPNISGKVITTLEFLIEVLQWEISPLQESVEKEEKTGTDCSKMKERQTILARKLACAKSKMELKEIYDRIASTQRVLSEMLRTMQKRDVDDWYETQMAKQEISSSSSEEETEQPVPYKQEKPASLIINTAKPVNKIDDVIPKLPSSTILETKDPEKETKTKQLSNSSDVVSLTSQVEVSKRRSSRISHPKWDDDYLPLSVLGD